MRAAPLDEAIAVVSPIVADVRERGDAALLDWTERLDGPRPDGIEVSAERIAAAAIGDEVLDALRRMIASVRAFNEAQLPRDTSVEAAPGIVTERRWLPLRAVGVCVPSRTSPLLSSLVMTAVPAQVAGVERIVVVTPSPADAILATARELGLDEVYAVGGAQAVAALAYGTETIAPVDVVVGPGNVYVTAAKHLVSAQVRIDLLAGPSEVVVIADRTATAERVAMDLLAQAEHGPESEAVLLTDDATLSGDVGRLVDGNDNIRVELVASLEDAVEWAERYAPEHLELLVAEPEPLLRSVRNAGSVFLGGSAAIGDYAAGATHVLPTGGAARTTGGLGVESFMKTIQVVRISPEGARYAAGVVGPLAEAEGLPRHAVSAAGGLGAPA